MNKAIYYLSYKLTINGEVFTANSSCIYGTEYNQEYNLVKFDTFDNLWEFVRSMNELMRELNPKDFLEYCYDQLIMVKKEQDDVAQQN